MKTFTLILIVALTGAMQMKAQRDEAAQRKTRYALELNQFVTGSGFSTGTELYITIVPDQRKSLSFGLHFNPAEGKLSGVTVNHKVALRRVSEPVRVMPYAFYNMIYRFTRTGDHTPEAPGDVSYGLYKSMEHHLGLGLDIMLNKSFHLTGGAGYGVYFGSIMKPTAPDAFTGEVTGSNGFGAIAKIGLTWII